MTGSFADRLFRIAFALAGCYNLAFGLWAAVWPLAFFRLFDIPPPRYPGIWACLGMVVGVYGLLYWHAAWKLENAWPIIAVGLLGKVLGPIGMAMSFSDDWPRRLGMICVFNDLIWWLPFGLFLVRGTAIGRRLAALAPGLCVAVHAVALAMLATVLRPATLIQTDAVGTRPLHRRARHRMDDWLVDVDVGGGELGRFLRLVGRPTRHDSIERTRQYHNAHKGRDCCGRVDRAWNGLRLQRRRLADSVARRTTFPMRPADQVPVGIPRRLQESSERSHCSVPALPTACTPSAEFF